MSTPLQNGGVRFYRSPDFMVLTEAWIENYRQRIAERDPLISEIVIVHSQAMARHLNEVLTRRLGVTALIEYLLPPVWENRIRECLLPRDKTEKTGSRYAENPYDPHSLRWILYFLLIHPTYRDALRELPVLGSYLFEPGKNSGQLSQIKAFQLAEIMADLFNSYLFFREEMLWEWDSTGDLPADTHWQKWLWQTLRQHLPHPHRQEELSLIKEVLRKPTATILPDHISVFGISFLPPYYLELFQALKSVMAIDYYYPDTTRPLEGNTLPERPAFLEKLTELTDAYLENIEKLHWEERFLPPLRTQPPGETPAPVHSFFTPLSPQTSGDTAEKGMHHFSNFRVHQCTDRRREVEVVKTEILSFLEKEGSLTLNQILILAPDILEYQDYLESVLTCDPPLPYYVIDRNENHTNTVIRALLSILDLFNSEWEMSKVKEILTLDILKPGQEWESEDILIIEEWLERLGVKRGRGESIHPDLEKYTWREGIRRLMFKLALPEDTLSQGKRLSQLYGNRAQTLGEMVYFIQKLLDYDHKFQKPTDLNNWMERIRDITHFFYLSNREYIYSFREQKDHARFIQQVKKMEESWDSAQNALDLNLEKEKIDLFTFTEILQANLKKTEHSGQGSHQGITCGSLLPLRIIPAEITFMMGMGRDSFPRHDRHAHFNLILQNPRPGDHTKRKGDQLLFLETLFATRRHLGITYSPGPDDSEKASPSVLVDELLSFLGSRSEVADLSELREERVCEHPPLPLPENHTRKDLGGTAQRYSYDPEDHRSGLAIDRQRRMPPPPSTLAPTMTALESVNHILRMLHRDPGQPPPGFLPFTEEIIRMTSKLKQDPENPDSPLTIVLKDLKTCLSDAPRFFFTKILGIDLDTRMEGEEDAEPLSLEGLEKYQILAERIEQFQPLRSPELEGDLISSNSVREDPLFPAGKPGENLAELLSRNLHRVKQKLLLVKEAIGEADYPGKPMIIGHACTPPLTEEVFSKKLFFWLEGHVEDVLSSREGLRHRVFCRYLKINVNDIIRSWCDHLFLNAHQAKTVTWLIGEKEVLFLIPPQSGKTTDYLSSLFTVYLTGHTLPLPLYKEPSSHYHEHRMKSILTCKPEEIPATLDLPLDELPDLDKIIFPSEQLYPPPTNRYAHYLWGNTENLPSQAEMRFSEFYHLLWGPVYQHLRKMV